MVKRLDHSEAPAVARGVREALAKVHDPEIPPLSIADLGIVRDVRVSDYAVEIDLLPTFAGCPALDAIREDAERAVAGEVGGRQVRVRFVLSPPWTSDMITEAGQDALRTYGLAPPESGGRPFVPLESVRRGPAGARECPLCGSRDTVQESAFGPTLCRSTHFCHTCRNPFEAFKPKSD